MTDSHANSAADGNLLFGILAVQMDFVRQDQLIAAMNAWVLNKATPLGKHLLAAGALSPETHALLDALVAKHVEQHGGRIEQSLAALSSVEPLKQSLVSIRDSDVQTSLARAGSPTPGGDHYATVAMPRFATPAKDARYQVLRPHAAGGLGKVWVARDVELNREVALKELHDRHADNPDNRARFLQEAEITGGLEHPGVVPIYGLGQYADGRPYYAMRFIRGDSLAEAIERFHREADPHWSSAADVLELRRLLNRFLEVCKAMEFADSRGVLHRDLNPGNIMLGRFGETLVVDWGLAKPLGSSGAVNQLPDVPALELPEAALQPQSGSGSAPTQMGSAVGTPTFMSPEQAAGRLDQLGPASDVYSLGATLYMLLTGKAPQNDDDLGVVIQRVQRGQFARPREVNPAAPKALEAICLKAMALAPAQRYPSPKKLAEDVEAWLADEPVTALQESAPTRAWRWVKKHRTLVTSAAGILMVAVLCLTVGSVLLNASRDAAVKAKNEALAAKAEADRQTGRNEELLALARTSLERYDKLSQSEQLKRYGMESLRSDLQQAAVEYYATLARQTGESEQARADRGLALYRLGNTYWQLGQIDHALESLRQSTAMFNCLEQELPENRSYQRQAGFAYESIGEILNRAQNPAAAGEPLVEARKRFSALHLADSKNVDDATAVAYCASLEGERLRLQGQMEEAAKVFEGGISVLRSIDLKPLDEGSSRTVRYRLSRALHQLGNLEGQALWHFNVAREHYKEARELMQPLFEQRPAASDCGYSLAQILADSAFLDSRENIITSAREQYLQAFTVLKQVEEKNPDVPHYRQLMAELLNSLGTLHHPLVNNYLTDEHMAQLEEAVAIGQKLCDQFPQEVDRQVPLARYKSSLGAAYHQRGEEQKSKVQFDAAVALLEHVSRETGDIVDTLYALGEMQYAMAEQFAKSERTDEALKLLDQAEATYNRLAKLAPRFREVHLSLAYVFIDRSNCYQVKGQYVDGVKELDRLTAKSAELDELITAPWMQSVFKSLLAVAKTQRWVYLTQARSGELNKLADRGDYQLAGDQARALPGVTGEASDHYAAAKTLAYAAGAALRNDTLPDQERRTIAEPLAADAVKQLELAWQKGYLRRRSGGFAGLISSQPTLKTLAREESLQSILSRDDFAAFVRRVETELPSKSGTGGGNAEHPPSDSK
jgi:serine/threonine-protein kinase